MEIDGEQRIAAAREDVWTALNDPQMLRLYTPGCDSLERISKSEFDGTVTVKAQVGGKLAQVGSRLIDRTVRELSGHFFANLGEHLAAGEVAPAAPLRPSGEAGSFSASFEEVKPAIIEALDLAVAEGSTDTYQLQQTVRRVIGRWVSSTHRRRPMIIPVVIES